MIFAPRGGAFDYSNIQTLPQLLSQQRGEWWGEDGDLLIICHAIVKSLPSPLPWGVGIDNDKYILYQQKEVYSRMDSRSTGSRNAP